MPDNGAPVLLIQNSFASGEIAPKLYGRTDLQKYKSGCAVMRNFYIDYKGGATTRPGSQYIGQFGSSGYGRLIPFRFSPSIGQTYILCFSDQKLRFIKNPGTSAYPNGSNAGLLGAPYEVTTPYLEADLRNLSYLQIADVMWITCHGYARRKLSRISDTNWTLTVVSAAPTMSAPTISAVNITALPAGSPDPQTTRYMYVVSAVDADGNESLPSVPFISAAGINLATTQGTVSIFWSAVANAVYYKVFKALPAQTNIVPNYSEQFGFIGYSYGTNFTDSNIVADFVQTPLMDEDPFAVSAIVGYTITAGGANYPVGGTTINVTDGTGSGAIIYPILDTNTAGAVGAIIGLYIARHGSNYSSSVAVAAAGGAGAGFTATLTRGPSTGTEPDVVGFVQQRLVYASSINIPNGIFAGRPGAPDDFRVSNPVVDNDAFTFELFDQQVTDIAWLRSMPGGLLIGTDTGVVQLTGGSSTAANPVAISSTNAVVVPQSYNGAMKVPPVIIDYDILYVQTQGSVVRDLQYNFLVNTYTGTDLTVLSSHLFESDYIVEWAYQDTPTKVVWAVMNSGLLLSLTFLKGQEIAGWARHDTQGIYESVASVQEGTIDAVYVSVNRNGTRYIERMSTQVYHQASDAWQLDSALSIASNYPAASLSLPARIGNGITVTASAAVFALGDINKNITAFDGIARVISFVSTTQVVVNILQPFNDLVGTDTFTIASGSWRLDPLVATVSGLTHLIGRTVYALVDGVQQGPYIVSSIGTVTLTTPGYQIVVGLAYSCSLQPLYIDVAGEQTIQGRLKKVTAASIRVRDTARLKYGTSFDELKEWEATRSSTDPQVSLPYETPGLYTGDQRLAVNQIFNVGGWVCVQQDYALPATILAIVPETAQGDTR